jgi:BCCT family betaine/carnitine transporter
MSTGAIKPEHEPARWLRLFWAGLLGAVAIILMFGGGLKALQTLSIITGFPIMCIFVFIVLSLFKWLKEDYPYGYIDSVPYAKKDAS